MNGWFSFLFFFAFDLNNFFSRIFKWYVQIFVLMLFCLCRCVEFHFGCFGWGCVYVLLWYESTFPKLEWKLLAEHIFFVDFVHNLPKFWSMCAEWRFSIVSYHLHIPPIWWICVFDFLLAENIILCANKETTKTHLNYWHTFQYLLFLYKLSAQIHAHKRTRTRTRTRTRNKKSFFFSFSMI